MYLEFQSYDQRKGVNKLAIAFIHDSEYIRSNEPLYDYNAKDIPPSHFCIANNFKLLSLRCTKKRAKILLFCY